MLTLWIPKEMKSSEASRVDGRRDGAGAKDLGGRARLVGAMWGIKAMGFLCWGSLLRGTSSAVSVFLCLVNPEWDVQESSSDPSSHLGNGQTGKFL